MGGAVSSGKTNHELVDNLVQGRHIKTAQVERVLRAVDRAAFMLPQAKNMAYKDVAWRYGHFHLSAPCIYSEVLEGLDIQKGQSFLNVGSGTGYLNTMVGLLVGASGVNHGIEMYQTLIIYAQKNLNEFLNKNPAVDEMDFCEPQYFHGNGLCLSSSQPQYDRLYCGAGCTHEYQEYFKQLVKVGGIMVIPYHDELIQLRKQSDTEWKRNTLLHVSFMDMVPPASNVSPDQYLKNEIAPASLQSLCRAAVRSCVRAGLLRARPELQPPPPTPPRPPSPRPTSRARSIRIPVLNEIHNAALLELHHMTAEDGVHEMNALLGVMLNAGEYHNMRGGRARHSSESSSSSSSGSPDSNASTFGDLSMDMEEAMSDVESSFLNIHEDHLHEFLNLEEEVYVVPGRLHSMSMDERPMDWDRVDDGPRRSRRQRDRAKREADALAASGTSGGAPAASDDSDDDGKSNKRASTPPTRGPRYNTRAAKRRRARRRPASHSPPSARVLRPLPSRRKRAAAEPPAPPKADRDVNRILLSDLMKEHIHSLPLPRPLKSYVNYGRPYVRSS